MQRAEENLAISRPHPKSLQTENWAFALLAHDWMICNADQRSLSLQIASKKPQILSGLVTSYMLTSVLWLQYFCMGTHTAGAEEMSVE